MGYKKIDIEMKKEVSSSSAQKIEIESYNLFYSLPIPVVQITLGVGAGKARLKCDGCNLLYQKEGDLFEGYLQAGFSFGLVGVHLGHHVFSGSIPGKSIASGSVSVKVDDLDVGGSASSLTVTVGF